MLYEWGTFSESVPRYFRKVNVASEFCDKAVRDEPALEGLFSRLRNDKLPFPLSIFTSFLRPGYV